MKRFQHDTERWLRNQAKVYTTRGNTGMACVFERCADDVATLRAQFAESDRRRVELVEAVGWERECVFAFADEDWSFWFDDCAREELVATVNAACDFTDALVGGPADCQRERG